MTTEDVVLELDDVEVHFESSGGSLLNPFADPDMIKAVDGVSLEIPSNEVVALVGESGCGKTTLGKAAIGVQRPTGGTVKYRGQEIWAAKDGRGDIDVPFDEIRQSLQIIHQDPGSSLNPRKRVMDCLEAPLKQKSDPAPTDVRKARILEMLEDLGMTPAYDYADRYPHQLSGGEKQRVALARALLMDPDLILADEAVSALDVSLRIEMMDLFLDKLDEFDTSFLSISHDLSNARYLAEKADGRIGVMYLGELVEVGPVGEIIGDPQHPYTEALRWATPDLSRDRDSDLPLRAMDIPDPKNPPSGCRLHTRCPHAREVCREESPGLFEVDARDDHRSACFRTLDDHEYWGSQPLEDTREAPSDDGQTTTY